MLNLIKFSAKIVSYNEELVYSRLRNFIDQVKLLTNKKPLKIKKINFHSKKKYFHMQPTNCTFKNNKKNR